MGKNFDSLFEEVEPYHNLQSRVTHGFYREIEVEAKKRKQTISEFIRDAIAIQVLGEVLKKRTSRLSPGQHEIIEACKTQLKRLTESLTEGVEHQQLVERAKKRAGERLTKNEVVQGVVEEVLEKLFPKSLKKRL